MILIIKTKHNLLDQKIYDFFIDYIKKHRETFFVPFSDLTVTLFFMVPTNDTLLLKTILPVYL